MSQLPRTAANKGKRGEKALWSKQGQPDSQRYKSPPDLGGGSSRD